MSTNVMTTTTTTTTTPNVGIKLNHLYFKTPPGILKIIQLLFGIICMACASPVVFGYAHFFMFVVSACFAVTFFLCSVYLFSVNEYVVQIPWLLLEVSFTGGAVAFYFIATVVQLACTSPWYFYYRNSYLAAGSFGLFNTVAYGAGFFFLFQDWKQSRGTVS